MFNICQVYPHLYCAELDETKKTKKTNHSIYIILLSRHLPNKSKIFVWQLHERQMPESTEEVRVMSCTLRLWLTGEYRGASQPAGPAWCTVSWALGHGAKSSWQLTGTATKQAWLHSLMCAVFELAYHAHGLNVVCKQSQKSKTCGSAICSAERFF